MPKTFISVGPKAGTHASQQINFQIQDISTNTVEQLLHITKNFSHSAVEFLYGNRKGVNFKQAHLVFLDFDENMTIIEALETFKPYYGFIVTTRSHQQSTKGGEPNGKKIVKRDRFRVILFLEEPIKDGEEFVTIMTNLINKYGSDQACKDKARYYFPNPRQEHWFLSEATQHIDLEPFKKKNDKKVRTNEKDIVKKIPKSTQSVSPGNNDEKKEYIFLDDTSEIISADGESNTALKWYDSMEIGSKISCHCPFPDHTDENPSAFISKTDKESLYAYCNSCTRKGFYNRNFQKKGSTTKTTVPVEDITVEINQFSNEIVQQLKTTGEFKLDDVINQFLSTDTPITSFAHSLYFYIDGYWQKHANAEIEQKVFIKSALLKIIGKRPKLSQIKQVRNELSCEYLDLVEKDEVLINFNNNVLKVIEGRHETLSHDQEFGMRYKLNFDFDMNAKCPKIDTFLTQVIGDQPTIDFFFEFISSIFISNDFIKIEKSVFLHGSGSNGKSILLDLLRVLLGTENISSVALKDMGDEKRRSAMVGNLLNIAAEGSQKSFNAEDFKSIISREPLPVRLLYKDSIEVDAFPRLIFATNNLPFTDGDYSHGIFRRIAIIPFENIIPEEKQDKKLLSKLLPELPGMMNRVIEGMNRLLQKGTLEVPEKVKQAGKKYESHVNPVKYFLDEINFIAGDSHTPIYSSDTIYREFKDFCHNVGIKPLSKRSFVPQVKIIFGQQVHSNKLYGWRIKKK